MLLTNKIYEGNLFMRYSKHLTYAERMFLRARLNRVRHITLDPDGPGVVRINGRIDDNGHVCIEFLDSGPGFDPATLPNLLDPFFTTKDGGTGLGLPIVQSIISSHGGVIKLENGPEGGALVRVLLPKAQTGA